MGPLIISCLDVILHLPIRTRFTVVPGRSIVDNVCLIRDVLEVSSSPGMCVSLLSLDQEKAFDCAEHSSQWKTVERFGFSTDLIGEIKVLYIDIESVLKFNGSLCVPSLEVSIRSVLCLGCSMCSPWNLS